MQIQNGFSEQGAGRGVDRACRHKGGWCHMLQDELRARRVSELSAQPPQGMHWETPAILCSLFQQLISPIALSDAPSRVLLSLLLLWLLQGDILTVIRRVDENWIEAKLGEKVGVCPLQFTEVSSAGFLPFFLTRCSFFCCFFFKRDPSGADKVDNPAVWPCNESDRGCSHLYSISCRSEPERHLFAFFVFLSPRLNLNLRIIGKYARASKHRVPRGVLLRLQLVAGVAGSSRFARLALWQSFHFSGFGGNRFTCCYTWVNTAPQSAPASFAHQLLL